MQRIILSKDCNKHKEGSTVMVDDLRAAWLKKAALKPRKERSRSEFFFGPYQTRATQLSQIAGPTSSGASRLRLQPRAELLFGEKSPGDSRDSAFPSTNFQRKSTLWAADSQSRSEIRVAVRFNVRFAPKSRHWRGYR